MNPLLSIKGTIISGFVLAIVFIMILTDGNIPIEAEGYIRWLHYLSGVTWIGLLYYFNFVQVPAMAKATAEKEPGPAAIGKYVAPLALLWFRWGAVVTWLTGAAYLGHHGQFIDAFTFAGGYSSVIGAGAWLGTIMLFNVGANLAKSTKVLGMVEASADEIAQAKKTALLASRTNTVLSIPMLLFMGGAHHPGLVSLASLITFVV